MGETGISILGCGWMGLPLARKLLEAGYSVKGSTTSQDKLSQLTAAGIRPYLLKVLPNEIRGDISSFLEDAKTLIIDFPPGIRKQPASDYIKSLELLIEKIKNASIKKVLFVSSISVYEDSKDFPVYTEHHIPNASSERGRGLIVTEELLVSSKQFSTTILRMGGLIGPDRHPVYQLAGREGTANPEAPINLIHQRDCIGIIEKILEKNSFGEIYNAVYPEHPSKEQYYSQKARDKGLQPPHFSRDPSKGKTIDPSKLQNELGYTFISGI